MSLVSAYRDPAPRRLLRGSSLEQTASYLRVSRSAQDDPGVRFIRRARTDAKDRARGRVLRAFGPTAWPGNLVLLTMPSVGWDFERQLLHIREHGTGLRRPRRTFIYAIERRETVYRAAMMRMPGVEATGLITKTPESWASRVSRTLAIQRFWCCTLTDYVAHGLGPKGLTGAWVDLNGPINLRLLPTLQRLWQHVGWKLLLTSLEARWDAATVSAKGSGSIADLVESVGPVADVYQYGDGSPMVQITLQRESPR